MCANYRLKTDPTYLQDAFSELKVKLRFPAGLPNLEPQLNIRITDRAPVVMADPEGARLEMMRWSWPGPSGKPVFNYRSEGRRFDKGRCLVLADGFYEFTGAKSPKDKWLFTLAGHDLFAIAGLVREGAAAGADAWTMLTCAPGPDLIPYHDRQVVVLAPDQWAAWLSHEPNEGDLLRNLPAGSFNVAAA